MSLSIRLKAETVRSLAFGSIGAAYMGVGTAMFRPIRIMMIQNLTDENLMFSFDGIDDNFPLPKNGYILLDVTANKTRDEGFFLAEGERLYVKEITATPTSGSVYFTTFYGAQ